MRHVLLIAFSILALVVTTKTADASAAGTWKSTSGNTFVIPESRTDFDLIRQGVDGSRELIKARWVDGMVGTQFTYVAKSNRGIACTATFNLRNPDTLRVQCNDGSAATVWTRVAQPKTGRGLVGTWQSSSGNQFTIPEKSRGEFDIIVKFTNGKKDLYRARWIEGMEGTQFTYGGTNGVTHTGTRNGENRDQIRIVGSDGAVTIWTRI